MDILRNGKLLVAIAFAAALPGASRAGVVLPADYGSIGATGPASRSDDSLGLAAPGRDAEIECLAQAVAYEAANEPESGRQAVAQVVINRLHHRAFPKTVCGVVFQGSTRRTGCQFTFTCDGSLRRTLSARTWADSRRIAAQAIDGSLPPQVGAATHYHADYVAPRWAPAMVRVGQIGAHVFYHFPGRGDLAGAGSLAAGGGRPARSQRNRDPQPYRFTAWGLTAADPRID